MYPDGFTPQYGAIGDAKLISTGKSWYIPEALGRPGLTDAAIGDMDYRLARMGQAAERLGGNGVVEIVTNNAQSAAVWEARMRALNIPGYVRLQS